MNSFLDKLKKYFNNTSREKIAEDWEATKEWDNVQEIQGKKTIRIKSYNTINDLLVVNTFVEEDLKQRSIYLIPVETATNLYDLCLNCKDDIILEDDEALTPLFDAFDYVEIDFVRLDMLINDGTLEDYRFDEEEINDLFYEQFQEEFQEEE
jgi:hypothetical protein